jgi:hypothetical protein
MDILSIIVLMVVLCLPAAFYEATYGRYREKVKEAESLLTARFKTRRIVGEEVEYFIFDEKLQGFDIFFVRRDMDSLSKKGIKLAFTRHDRRGVLISKEKEVRCRRFDTRVSKYIQKRGPERMGPVYASAPYFYVEGRYVCTPDMLVSLQKKIFEQSIA